MATATDGVFIAGCAQGPKDIPSSVAQASGAAANALTLVSHDQVTLEPTIAYVNESLCHGCGRCEEVCPYHALKVTRTDGQRAPTVSINHAVCKGCGACAVRCPAEAITVKHFSRDQIGAMIDALAPEPVGVT